MLACEKQGSKSNRVLEQLFSILTETIMEKVYMQVRRGMHILCGCNNSALNSESS
jgi:hypothetical protein